MYLASFLDIMPLLLVVMKIICQLEASISPFRNHSGENPPRRCQLVYNLGFDTTSLPLFEEL